MSKSIQIHSVDPPQKPQGPLEEKILSRCPLGNMQLTSWDLLSRKVVERPFKKPDKNRAKDSQYWNPAMKEQFLGPSLKWNHLLKMILLVIQLNSLQDFSNKIEVTGIPLPQNHSTALSKNHACMLQKRLLWQHLADDFLISILDSLCNLIGETTCSKVTDFKMEVKLFLFAFLKQLRGSLFEILSWCPVW